MNFLHRSILTLLFFAICFPVVGQSVKTSPEEEPQSDQLVLLEKQPYMVNQAYMMGKIGFPEEAKKQKITEKVIVRILVGRDGSYLKHTVLKEGHPILLEAVEKHIAEAKFTPAIQAGNPIKAWVTIPFEFALEKDSNKKRRRK